MGTSGGFAFLLQWQYLIFLLPFALGAFFLLLSAVRLPGGGHRHASTAGSAHSQTHSHQGGHAHVKHVGKLSGHSDSRPSVTPVGILLLVMGVGRAPLPLVLEMFCLLWGMCGFWATRLLLPQSTEPSLAAMLPPLGIALAGGLVGGRIAAELVGRLLPQEETSVVSREQLYGLTGQVVFAVSETGGRIHLYDDAGTLHDEMCRVAEGHPAIPKGHYVIVLDRDVKSGRLVVEETSKPLLSGRS